MAGTPAAASAGVPAAVIRTTGFIVAIAMAICLPAHAAGPTVQARVVACYDGDTCTLDRYILPGRNRVRLRNADTAEIEAHCPAEKQLALRAKAFTSQLVGRIVTLDDIKPDKYAKRVDAYVTMPDGRDLGRALIAAGLARPYDGGRRAGWCE